MKKTIFSFTVLSILTAISAVHAEEVTTLPDLVVGDTNVPTKEYVDSGLVAVHTRSKARDEALQGDVDELTIYVGAPAVGDKPATGLTKQISDISTDIENLRNDVVYSGANAGVDINDDKTVTVTGLNAGTRTNGRTYVFRNNMASELEMADTWVITAPAATTPATTPDETPVTPGTGD